MMEFSIDVGYIDGLLLTLTTVNKWGALCSSCCLNFFPFPRVVSLRLEVLSFTQKEKESLGTSWEHFKDLINTGPDLAIQDHQLLVWRLVCRGIFLFDGRREQVLDEYAMWDFCSG